MESEQRTPREMTYKVGWKRNKIVSAPVKTEPPQAGSGQPEPEIVLNGPLRSLFRLNDSVLWKETRIPSVKPMQAVVFLLPAIVFALFVWLAYWLSRFS